MFVSDGEATMGTWLENGPGGNRAYLATPEQGNGAGVLVLHAWWGLTADFTAICDRLAANGFVALAPGLYPDGATAQTIPEAEALRDQLDEAGDETEAVVEQAAEQLLDLPGVTGARIGVIGFSLGAYFALQLSQSRPDLVSAAVTVYGTDDGDYSTATAAYLGHFAENDDYEPLDLVQTLEGRIRAAGREATFHTYPGTSHWFFEPSQTGVYDAEAAELVWERTLAFLKEQLA